MTNCDKFLSLYTEYLDGTLSGQSKSEFDGHLKQCADCTAILRRLTALQVRLKELPAVRTSDAFHILLRSRIRRELETQTLRQKVFSYFQTYRIPAYGISVAMLLLISFATYSYFQQNPKETMPTNLVNSQSTGNQAGAVIVQQQDGKIKERIHFILDELPPEKVLGSGQKIDSNTLHAVRQNQRLKLDSVQTDPSYASRFYQAAHAATVTF